MKLLFKKVNIASLVLFRIVFGILGFADVVGSYIGKHIIEDAFDTDKYQFKYYGFEWVKTLPDPWLTLLFLIAALAAIGICLGKWYRFSATIFAIGFSYIFFLEKAYYLNHGYLTMLIAWWIIFLPLAKNYSIDVLEKTTTRVSHVSYWSLFLLQFMMGVVYFYGGLAKINVDWLNGMPLKMWLKQRGDMPLLGYFWRQEWVAYFMSYGGMLLDLFVVFLLLKKRTRILALGLVLFFHSTNMILFQIGIFPFLSVTLTLLFFEPEFPIKAWNWLEQKFSKLERISIWWANRFNQQEQVFDESKGQKKIIKGALVLFALIMLFVPFRHHLFKGNVAWTEEGHRYSWRMMLRQKRAYGEFNVKNLKTNEVTRIQLNEHLTKRQKRKLLTHPDMILQFSHYLRDTYEAEYGNDVAVFTNLKANLNGRKYQVYIDPEVNLAKEEWNFFEHKEWIMPLED